MWTHVKKYPKKYILYIQATRKFTVLEGSTSKYPETMQANWYYNIFILRYIA